MDTVTQGEYRCLTTSEIARAVKSFRELAGIKQLTLAQLAGVTERTIQRLEEGTKVSDDTLRQLAVVLGFEPNAFVGPRHVASSEDAAQKILRWFEAFQIVDAPQVEDWRAFEMLMLCDCLRIMDSEHYGDAAMLSATLKDSLGDCMWVAPGATASERLEWAQAMVNTLDQIREHGVCARFAIGATTDHMKLGALMLVPIRHPLARADRAVMPRDVMTEFTAEDERMAHRVMHDLIQSKDDA